MNLSKITKIQSLSFFAVALTASLVITQFDNSDHHVNVASPKPVLKVDQAIEVQEKVTPTEEVLGFGSKLGALPSSLNGTLLGAQLETNEQGHLIISDDIKYIFDYFLSTITEEDLDTILLRIDEYLNHYLEEPALSESKTILAHYIELKKSLLELEQEMGAERTNLAEEQLVGGQYLDLLRERLNLRNALRAEHLDPEVNEVFYQDEEVYDEYTYSRLRINADKSLQPDERAAQIAELQQQLPEDVQHSMRETQIIDELNDKTEQLLAEGGSQQQVRELRKEMFGEEAANRFDALDNKRAQWKARMDIYLTERTKILNTEGLPQEVLQLQVNTLRETHFEASEQMKAKVFEKRSEV
jgi:lipase chaperone LimK